MFKTEEKAKTEALKIMVTKGHTPTRWRYLGNQIVNACSTCKEEIIVIPTANGLFDPCWPYFNCSE